MIDKDMDRVLFNMPIKMCSTPRRGGMYRVPGNIKNGSGSPNDFIRPRYAKASDFKLIYSFIEDLGTLSNRFVFSEYSVEFDGVENFRHIERGGIYG